MIVSTFESYVMGLGGNKRSSKTMWSTVFQAVRGFTKGSRWRKASKCKSLTRQVQSRLITQKNRRDSLVRQSRADAADLLCSGQLQKALDKVEQLYKDQCLLSAYDQIGNFCDCIITNMSCFSSKSITLQSLPNDVSEAVSSLIFAASRCGDLPELRLVRDLFIHRYGCKFEADVELLPGNLVNPHFKHSLCLSTVTDDVKLDLIREIARKCTLDLSFREFENKFHAQIQSEEVLDLDFQDISSDNYKGSTQSSKFVTPIRKDVSCYSLSSSKDFATKPWYLRSSNSSSSSARTSSDSTPRVSTTSFVYLDDTNDKVLNQENGGKGKELGQNGMDLLGGSVTSAGNYNFLHNNKKHVHHQPTTWSKNPQPCKNYERKKAVIGAGLSSSSSSSSSNGLSANDGKKKKREWVSSPSHVHPKLPEYENVAAKLMGLKLEHKLHRRFSYS